MAAWRGARGFESHDIVMPGTVTRACFLSIVITTALTHPRGRDRGTAEQKNLVNVPFRSIYEVFCTVCPAGSGKSPFTTGDTGGGRLQGDESAVHIEQIFCHGGNGQRGRTAQPVVDDGLRTGQYIPGKQRFRLV